MKSIPEILIGKKRSQFELSHLMILSAGTGLAGFFGWFGLALLMKFLQPYGMHLPMEFIFVSGLFYGCLLTLLALLKLKKIQSKYKIS